ncbi:4Fe-4S dicluster domain-containing protein [Pseudodesulfovibrio sp. zrk46]|uniref:4Fe-4S dicluster domain-containing protein n=1 Tax=Pseudodesulfovibrio sp. zrk46 TaxID=2725288 RepID=UPI0032B5DA3B
MSYKQTKDQEDLGKVKLEIKEKVDDSPAVVIGCRSCDAAGFNTFDRVYLKDSITDQNYLARRENTVLISLVCEKPATTCFCNWVGGSPASADGADVQMTPLTDGWLVEAITERGEVLMLSAILTDGADRVNEAAEVKSKAEDNMPEAPQLDKAPEQLLGLFDNADFWESMSAKCISCGTCTYLCPTCYCFNITDEACGMEGVRLRTWDNCMSSQFTMEASGHNPRPTKAHRLKNRIGHKFSYYPTLHGGNIACVGCGRCIKSCPVSVDIRSVIVNAMAAEVVEMEK